MKCTTAAAGAADPDWAIDPPGQTPGLLDGMLAGPLADVEEVIYAVRSYGREWHWYANFGYFCDNTDHWTYSTGPGQLVRYNLRTGQRKVILEDVEGAVRHPQVHYDGEKILFSYRPGGTHYYHLYEINIDGTGLTRLTNGQWDDYEPTYTPDGGIVFCSSRCKRYVPCLMTQVGIMYRCDADGSDIRRISAGVEHENTPWMLPDGRLLYTRWQYVNRSEKAYHHLWVINPDGTAQMVYYGNGAIRGNVMIDAKPIPGGNRIVSVFSMGHGITEHRGKLMVIDPDAGPDSPSAARRLDSGFPGPEQKRNMTYTWRDPYAISEDCFLVASHDGLYVMDGQGRYERIHRLPAEVQNDLGRIALHEPRPLRARRRELTIPSRVDWGAEHGTFVLSDVTVGRNMSGVEPDTVKKLLILEELPKPVSVCWNKDSVSLFTTYMLHRIVGTVPVQPDGSAHFNAPALRPLFFIALDKDNRPVQRMQSFVSVMPGETVSCVGCHEPRTHTPPVMDRNMPLAATREPDAIDPVSGVPDVMDYRRDIQPVWNKHCTGCHNYDKYAGELVLTDDLGPRFANSYMFLHKRGQMWYPSSRGQNPPYKTGSEASKLYQVLKAGHKKVRLSEGEMKTIRLWIEASSHYAGTYAALGSAKNDELVMDFDRDVLKKRCYRCHLDERALRKIAAGKTAHWPRGRGEGYTVNISNPLNSLLLLAPLSKDDGGLGLCRDKTTRREDRHRKAPRIDIFADRNDPDYQQLEKVLTAYGRAQMVNPRQWGTPAWQPPDYYIGEMKRYGVLPDNWQATDKTDWFEIDKRYYRTIDE